MDIVSLGHSSFRLRGKSAVLVTDPYDSELVGLKFPKNIDADMITISHEHPDHNDISQVGGTPYILRGPGEYEIKGVSIEGIRTYHDIEKGALRGTNTMYHIQMDGINILHVGDLGHTLSAGAIEEVGKVDILFVPVGGVYTIDAKHAAEIVHEIEPWIVIPMHYQREGLNLKTFADLAPVSNFLKEIGKETVVPQPKLGITKDKIPTEMQVIVLE